MNGAALNCFLRNSRARQRHSDDESNDKRDQYQNQDAFKAEVDHFFSFYQG